MTITKISTDDAILYLNWSSLFLVGRTDQADAVYRIHRDRIRLIARTILQNMIQQFSPEPVIYRGISLHRPGQKKLTPDARLALSFSEDKACAAHFADPSPQGFGREIDFVPIPCGPDRWQLMRMCDVTSKLCGDQGYLIEHKPDYSLDVLFHWRMVVNTALPYGKAFSPESMQTIASQKEVIIDPMGKSFDLTPYNEFIKTHGPQKFTNSNINIEKNQRRSQ